MAAPHLIHCSYHKCLTVYYKRVMDAVFNRCLIDDFYDGFRRHRVASVNNRALDLGRLGKFRLSRFLRDPRDLVVSGYFYHRRGAEAWTTAEARRPLKWYFANGCVPEGLRADGSSYARYLQSIPEEEGLLAELEFRRHHFESMAAWPERPGHRHLSLRRDRGRRGAGLSRAVRVLRPVAPRADPGELVREALLDP